MTRDAEPAGLTELIDALLECTAPITQILDRMARAPEPPTIDAALNRLRTMLRDVLGPLADSVDLRAATVALEATVPLIVEGIFLVPHASGPSNRAARRRQRRRPSH